MNAGDVIKFESTGYVHYAIFIGMEPVDGNAVNENNVIHWWKDASMPEPSVLITPFQRLADNMNHMTISIQNCGLDFTQVVERSINFKSRLNALKTDTENFSGLFDDSYHFVSWCRNGLGRIDITPDNIMTVRDPWRFVHGSVTNMHCLYDTVIMLPERQPGDIIRFFHRHYEHWAMYLQNRDGVPRVIHLWDKDSVETPRIAIHQCHQIMGCCKAENFEYKGKNINGEIAALNAEKFIEIVTQFPDTINQFHSSKQFAFWCCFGLGKNDWSAIPAMNTQDDVNTFVKDLMNDSDPDFIRRANNTAIQNMLTEGDEIIFCKGSQKHFGLYTIKQGNASVMYWVENVPAIMIVPFKAISENMKIKIENDPDPNNLRGAINRNEMVNRAYALRRKIRETTDDCKSLFANSKHFVKWIFINYGPEMTIITPEEIEMVEDVWQHIYKFKPSKKPPEDKIQIRHQNRKVLNALKEGDLVKFYRKRAKMIRYKHYAVYIANDVDTDAPSVIHWYTDPIAQSNGNNPKICIRSDSFWTVAEDDASNNGNNWEFENSDINGRKVVKRAKELKLEFEEGTAERQRYHLLWNNCEHFANDCRYRKHYSQQTRLARFFEPCCNRPQQ